MKSASSNSSSLSSFSAKRTKKIDFESFAHIIVSNPFVVSQFDCQSKQSEASPLIEEYYKNLTVAKKNLQVVPVGQAKLFFRKESLDFPFTLLNRYANKEAQRCFKNLQNFMGDIKHNKTAYQSLVYLISLVIEEDMAEELVLQVVNQLKGNNSVKSRVKGYLLLGITLSLGCITEKLQEAVQSFLNSLLVEIEEEEKITLGYCLFALESAGKKRQMLPTDYEILCLTVFL